MCMYTYIYIYVYICIHRERERERERERDIVICIGNLFALVRDFPLEASPASSRRSRSISLSAPTIRFVKEAFKHNHLGAIYYKLNNCTEVTGNTIQRHWSVRCSL